jgi:hypothetical protein
LRGRIEVGVSRKEEVDLKVDHYKTVEADL